MLYAVYEVKVAFVKHILYELDPNLSLIEMLKRADVYKRQQVLSSSLDQG